MRRLQIGKWAALAVLTALLMGVGSMSALADGTQTGAGTATQTGTGEGTQAAGETEAPAIPAPTEYAHITRCEIVGGSQIAISGEVKGTWSDPAYYDNYLYLFEMQPYEDDLNGRTDYSGWITKGDALSFTLPLNLGTAEDRLYSKFVVAVYDGEKYTPVGNTVYVTNPEAVAKHTDAYRSAQTKKGLLIENTTSMVADAFELGVNHVIVNIPFHHILGQGITYEYDGKTYSFNKELMETYDNTIRRMSEKNMTVTAVILNGWNDSTPQLVYPGVTKQPSNQVFYYGFNASTPEGCETIKAIASFLADRYSSYGSSYGKVSNWIIGNEINNQQWNYMGPMGLEQYVQEYARAFRVFYTAIRSTSSNDRLFFSTDYNWNHEANGSTKYNAKDVVDRLADLTGAGGSMDWGLAYHPYSIPMTEPEFWDDDQTGLIKQDASSPVINLKNLSVLTDYMQQGQLRMRDGSVRHMILSEQGFTSKSATRGVNYDLQAAAIAYAYYIADSNPYIDAFIMSRQVDAPLETKDSLMFGLWHCDENQPNAIAPTMRKKSWTIYKNIDNKKTTLETTEFAKQILGIQKWSDVIPNFRWRAQER
ncbi:MAG: DUF5722 domain-containing protein [Eubacteriales bacterium]|nr:DUF5722 domain-containing protein [Eubacteriales bacterium]